MLGKFFVAAVALGLVGTGLNGDEIKGKFIKVDGEKLTVTVEGKETTFLIVKDIKVLTKNKKEKTKDLAGGISSLKTDDVVTLTTEKKDDKELVSKITIESKKKKKKDK